MPLLFKGAPAVTYAVWFFFAAPFGSVMFVAGAYARTVPGSCFRTTLYCIAHCTALHKLLSGLRTESASIVRIRPERMALSKHTRGPPDRPLAHILRATMTMLGNYCPKWILLSFVSDISRRRLLSPA